MLKRQCILAVDDCKMEFCGSAGDSHKKCLRAFDMNVRKMRRVGREALDLSVEGNRMQSD